MLGCVLHCLIPGLLTLHGEVHALALSPSGVAILGRTIAYRFPEVFRARRAFELFAGLPVPWRNDFDQWQNRAPHGE